MTNNAASNVIPMRDFDRTSLDPQAAQFERLLKECQKLALERLSQAVAAMLDKVEDALWGLADQTHDRELRDRYIAAKDKALAQRKLIEDQFRENYLTEFETRARRERKGNEFSQYDLSSLELGLVNDEDLEETLKVNDMASKLRRYCEEELNALDQRIGVLIGDANLQGEGNPFSPQAVCNAYKQTCRNLESNMKIRMIFHKLFDDHVLDEVRSIFKDLNALLIQRSILPKIRFGVRRTPGAIARRPGSMGAAAMPGGENGDAGIGAGPLPAGVNPLAGMAMPLGMSPTGSMIDTGYGIDAGGGEQDLFAVLQSLLVRTPHPSAMPGAVPGAGAGMLAGGVVQVPGFPPIIGAAVTGGAGPGVAGGPLGYGFGGLQYPVGGSPGAPGAISGIAGAMGVPPLPGSTVGGVAAAGVPLAGAPQRFLQGAELIGSLTRLQHGDLAMMPGGLPAIDLSGLTSGTTNVVRELKSSSLGNQVDQTDGVTIDIVAMLFDQIFGDKRVPEALKALIGRLQIPVVKVAVLDKRFFSKKSHPARRMLDTLGEFALGLDESFDASSPLYQKIAEIIARLLEEFVDNVDIFEPLQEQLLAVIREENKRAEDSAKEMARKIAYKERLEVGKAMAQLEIKNRAQSRRMPQLVQKFLADEWVKVLLLTYARHGQDSEAWKSALETMDLLIWSVTFKPSVEDRRKLAHLLPALLKRLQAGLQAASATGETRKHFFSKLMRLHTKVMSGTSPKPAPQASAVSTLNEEVRPAPSPAQSSEVSEARQPAAPAAHAELKVPSIPVFDFGPDLTGNNTTPADAPPQADVSEHRVASQPIPVMTPASPAATPASAPAEVDEEAEAPAAPLEFSNVVIKNPFGEGDLEVEEISLADLPGFATRANSNSDAGATDQYTQAVKKLKTGAWLEFHEGDEHRVQARLSYISPLKGTYLFVNRQGEKLGEYSLYQLAQELRAARATVLEDVPLIDRAMSSLVGALKKNTR